MFSLSTSTLLSILATFQAVHAHTWAEQLRLIGADGAFTEDPGYPAPFFPRGTTDVDNFMVHRIDNSNINVAKACRPRDSFEYSAETPRLTASAGDYVAMIYHENGHVTDPNQTLRKYRGGNVYIYGSLDSSSQTDSIHDVLYAWNEDGSGGNGKGKLIGGHYYDDLHCFQKRDVEPMDIFNERSQRTGLEELLCQADFRLPDDLPEEGVYTVMWVWDWPLIGADGTEVPEIYTTCAEIQLRPGRNDIVPLVGLLNEYDRAEFAIQSQIDKVIEVTSLGAGQEPPAALRKRDESPDAALAHATPTADSEHVSLDAEATTLSKVVRAAAPRPTTFKL